VWTSIKRFHLVTLFWRVEYIGAMVVLILRVGEVPFRFCFGFVGSCILRGA
jgi:hypothetical protein